MSRKRKRNWFMLFLGDYLPDDIWENIVPWIFLLKRNEKFVTAMRNFRTLLLTSKRFYRLFNKDYYWLLCACHLPYSYKEHLKPFIWRKRIEFRDWRKRIEFRASLVVDENYQEYIKNNPKRFEALKEFLIQKYKLYLLQTKTAGLERRLLKK